MDKKECIKCLAVLKQNYFASFSRMTDEDLKAMVNLWSAQFIDETYSEVMTAINYIISTDIREFAPPIGVIRAKIAELKAPCELSVMEAWDKVRIACGKPDGFKTLPKNIQKAVGSSSTLRSWGEADTNVFNSSIMANFRRSYEAVIQKEKENLRLPSSVKEQIDRLQGKEKLMLDRDYTNEN